MIVEIGINHDNMSLIVVLVVLDLLLMIRERICERLKRNQRDQQAADQEN